MTSFMGKILRVDLSARTAEAVPIPPEVYEAVLAGKGLAAWYLYKNIPAGVALAFLTASNETRFLPHLRFRRAGKALWKR